MPVSVLLVERYQLVREGLRCLLKECGDVTVAGEAGCGDSALERIRELKPDILVTGIELENLNGIDLIKRATEMLPELGVVVVSAHSEQGLVDAALQAGARGYVTKTVSAEELREAVNDVAEGHSHLCKDISEQLVRSMGRPDAACGTLSGLTEREREVVQLLAKGYPAKEVAQELGISPKTVQAHRRNVMKKVGCRSDVGLTKFAIRHGLARLSD